MGKISRNIFFILAAGLLMISCFSSGMIVGWKALPILQPTPTATSVPIPTFTNEAQPTPATDLEQLFVPFWRSWDLVHTYYIEQPVDNRKLMEGAIRGMIESLGDQHSSYLDPDQFEQLNVQQSGEYEGIGAWVDITGEYLIIIAPMKNSPAEKAGLKAEDVVIAVDGEDMTGVDGNLVLKRILGPAGTQVTLTIVRKGEPEPFDVTITRQKIIVPSVEGEMLDNGIGYVQIYNFGDKTTNELRSILRDIMAEKPKGLIVDLRNNGGGYVNVAVEVISQFIKADQIVLIEQFGDGREETLTSIPGGLAQDIPLVVLVNEGTASASEIMAGVIQDYQRGTIVGVTTYGKGSVQIIQPLSEEDGAVRITIAHWLTPNRRQINKIGIQPDIVVEYTEEDFNAGKDPQLDKAIELLSRSN